MGTVGPGQAVASFALLVVLTLVGPVATAEASGEARVRSDLERFLRARSDGDSLSIEIPKLRVFEVDRSRYPGPLRTELSTRSKAPFRGRVPVTVALFAGDQLVKRSVVSTHLRSTEQVVVPSRDLRRGDVLTADDVRTIDVDASKIPADALRDVDAAIGQRVKRSVRSDRALRGSAIEGVPIVARGDRVMLVLESGTLQLQSVGRAREAGAFGEWIRVVNLDSNRELSGRVDRQGRVHIGF